MSALTSSHFWQVFASQTITVPVFEVMLALIMIAACLMGKWTRVGLVLTFLYVYRWGWIFMHSEFVNHQSVLMGYYFAGFFVLVVSIIAFIMGRE